MDAFQFIFLLVQIAVTLFFIYVMYVIYSKIARMFSKTTRKTKRIIFNR